MGGGGGTGPYGIEGQAWVEHSGWGRVWQDGGCGERKGVARGRVWQEGGCGKRGGTIRKAYVG